jgi:putative ABC transport system permease protein
MTQFRQIAALLQLSLSGIPQRLGTSLVAVIGIACVVGVLISMLSMGSGLRRIAIQNNRADRAVVSSKGAQSLFASNLSTSTLAVVESAPGIKKDAEGKPLATAYVAVLVNTRRKSNHVRSISALFGVTTQFFKVYPEVEITAGRTFRPGLHELIAGKKRYEQFEGLEVGDKIRVRGADWTVVGNFSANGGGLEDLLLADADTVASAFGRTTMQTVTVLLDSPQKYYEFAGALKANPALEVDVKHEAEWSATITKTTTGILDFISYFVGTVMAIGASLGALNVMYSIIDARKREIATLRAIGFGGGPIVVSVLLESVLLSLPGALLGAAIAWAWFNGNTVHPFGTSIPLAITPALVILGIVWALVIGLIGGILPALRSARVSVTTALRAT